MTRARVADRHRRLGLTLVELLAVLVLMGLLAAAAAVQVRQPLAEVRQKHAIAELRSLDALARDRARQVGKVQMAINMGSGSATLVDENKQTIGITLVLHRSLRFHAMLGATVSEDSVRLIEYDRYGTSPTFAISMGPAQNKEDWLLVLGMTGQTYQDLPRGRIDAIMQAKRNHSD